MRYALIVEYEGTRYNGFQYQENAPSVQEEIERAIARFTGKTVRIKAAGRTDAGVHAKRQVVAFDSEAIHPTGGGAKPTANCSVIRNSAVTTGPLSTIGCRRWRPGDTTTILRRHSWRRPKELRATADFW